MKYLRYIRNLISYLLYYFLLDKLRLVCVFVDIFVLGWSIFNWRDVFAYKSLAFVIIGVGINFVWQVFNVMSHFNFLNKENAKGPLIQMLDVNDGKVDYSSIKVKDDLTCRNFPYEIDRELGVLRNSAVDSVLADKTVRIEVSLDQSKHDAVRTYIKQYKDTLIKFLNHKWYEVTQKGGKFTNDKKICLSTELFVANGKYNWKICKGGYFDGYLTNFIFAQYVGGTHYKLYPPMNVMNSPIRPFTSSDYSDHIGVSTFLLTSDGYIIVNIQGDSAGYAANMYAPSGSGSLDYSDYRPGEDFRQMIIRGAERELGEETSLKKNMKKKGLIFEEQISTSITCFYRDMERGGKPEFCCLTRIDMPSDDIAGYLKPEPKEIAPKGVLAVMLKDNKSLKDCLRSSSLTYKICYFAMLEVLKKEGVLKESGF